MSIHPAVSMRGMTFLAITPAGRAIFADGDRYASVALGQRSPGQSVTPAAKPARATFVVSSGSGGTPSGKRR